MAEHNVLTRTRLPDASASHPASPHFVDQDYAAQNNSFKCRDQRGSVYDLARALEMSDVLYRGQTLLLAPHLILVCIAGICETSAARQRTSASLTFQRQSLGLFLTTTSSMR